MKNRKNRIVSLVLAAAMLTGCVLTGCGGNEKGAEETKKGSKEVTLWTHNGEAFVKETKKAAENFEKETGIKVNIQSFPYDAMSQKMKAAFTGGNEPDIIQGFGAWMPTYINQGLLAEVPEDLASKFETDYLQGAIDGYAKDGKYYGVPIEMNVEYGLFYYPEKAKEAGIEGAPSTFEDVLKIARQSAKYNGDVQEYGGLEFHNGDNFAALFLSWILQNGGSFWDDGQTHMVLTSEEAKISWQQLVDMVVTDKVTDTKHITEKMPTEQYFFANKAAQLVKGSWASAVGDELGNTDWAFTFMPPVAGDIPYFVVEAGWAYVVSENSNSKDEAWQFIEYCMQPENAKAFNLGTGTISSLKEVIDDPSYMEDEANVRVKDQYQYLQYANSVGPVQDMDFVKKTMLDTFDKAVAGKMTTDEALAQMEKDINAHIDELLAQSK
ncbi:extracellular solute-binding protein [Faecalicatena orotica]|uniref:extracellular solute-binding protein n=1 Tax=Faecalicatena orotica TaxID=1544 RepID=UPI003216BC29